MLEEYIYQKVSQQHTRTSTRVG